MFVTYLVRHICAYIVVFCKGCWCHAPLCISLDCLMCSLPLPPQVKSSAAVPRVHLRLPAAATSSQQQQLLRLHQHAAAVGSFPTSSSSSSAAGPLS
jgi:hypothetical protein